MMVKERSKKGRKKLPEIPGTEPDTSVGTKQITVPFQAYLLEEARELAERMSKGGVRVTPTTVIRAGLFKGLPCIEEEGFVGAQSNGGSSELKQQTLYLDVALIDQAKKLAEGLSVSGLRVTYMAVFRMALAVGLPVVAKAGTIGAPD